MTTRNLIEQQSSCLFRSSHDLTNTPRCPGYWTFLPQGQVTTLLLTFSCFFIWSLIVLSSHLAELLYMKKSQENSTSVLLLKYWSISRA